MSKFVRFFAEGVVYKRDKYGNSCGIASIHTGTGITLNNTGLTGRIFGQCPDLLPCDNVSIETHPIG